MTNRPQLDLALRAVGAACAVTRYVQSSLQKGSDVHTKADRSPVTVADLAAQAVIALFLGESFVGEESSRTLREAPSLVPRVLDAARRARPELDEARLLDALGLGEAEPGGAPFWTLDPVDGTKGFIRDAQYCVSLARIEAGRPTLGVLGCPRLGPGPGEVDGAGAMAWAERDGEARIAPLDDLEASVRLRAPVWSGGPVRVAESAESAHSDHDLGPRLVRRAGLPAGPPVRVDSQVKYAVVARGDAQVFLRRPRGPYVEKIWDHAAGAVVAESAGCVVSDLDGHPLDFSVGRELRRNRGLLVAGADLHARFVAALEAEG